MRNISGLLLVTLVIGGIYLAQPSAARTEMEAAATGALWQGWTVPVKVSGSPPGEPRAVWPTLGVGADGRVVYVAWSDGRGTKKDIYYAASADGGWNWGTEAPAVKTSTNSLRPSLVVVGTTPFIAWADEDPAEPWKHTTHQMLLGGGSYYTVANDHRVLACAPRMAVGVGGDLNMALQGGLNNITDVLFSHKTAGETAWPAASPVFTHPPADSAGSSDPALAISADGQTIHLVWREKFGTTESKIYYKRGQRSGTSISWDDKVVLSEGLAVSVRPAIAVSGGAVHVVWGEVAEGGQFVRYRSRDGAGNWSASSFRIDPEPILLHNLLPTELAPSLAITPSGAICVAWNGYRPEADLPYEDIYLSCSTNQGYSWSKPVNVSRSPEDSSLRPALVAASDGILHMAWQEYAGPSAVDNYEIYYSHGLPYSVFLPIIAR